MNIPSHRILLICIALISTIRHSPCHVPVPTNLGIHVPTDLPPAPLIQNVNVALVLGGGGARGFAHVGVLEILEQENIPIDLIIGTSAGAIVGSLYASFTDAQYIKNLLLNLGKWDFIDLSPSCTFRMLYSASGPISGYSLEKFFLNNLPQRQIEELKIPFAAVAVDVESGEPFIIKSGPIAPAIHASAALPPFFSPVKLYGKTLIDGGIALPVPVAIAKTYNPKLIIAVNIAAPPPKGYFNDSYQLNYRALRISYYVLAKVQAESADINIHPNLEGFSLFDDTNNEEIYRRGVQATLDVLPSIKQKLFALGIPLKNQSLQTFINHE